MMAISTPATLSSFRDSKLTKAGNSLFDALTLARQNAMSRNTLTAVVLVNELPSDTSISGRALALLDMNADGVWNQIGGWIILPEGTRAFEGGPSSTSNSLPQFSDATPPPLRFRGSDIGAYTAIAFKPDGTMFPNSPSIRTAYVQFANDTITEAPMESGIKNFYGIAINPGTGSLHIVRR